MYIFNFFINLHFISGVLVPFFLDWGKISFTQVMILQSWFMFWIFILEVPTGAFADYVGRKQSLVLAVAVNILAAIVYASVPDFYVFLLGEFLWALSVALMSGTEHALVYDTLNKMGETKKSKTVFGRIESFRLAGIMAGAPIGSIIAAYYGLRETMLLLVVPFSIAFFIAMTFKEPKIFQKTGSKNYIKILKSGVNFFTKIRF